MRPAARSCASLAAPGAAGHGARPRPGRARAGALRAVGAGRAATAARDGDRPLPEGLGDVLRAGVHGLLERGWDVHVLCNRSNKDQWPTSRSCAGCSSHDDRLHIVHDSRRSSPSCGPTSCTSATGRSPGAACTCARRSARKVVSFRGYDINYSGSTIPGLRRRLADADMLHARQRPAVGARERRGCPADKPHPVITDAVDVSRFAAAGARSRRGRERRPAAAAAERRPAALEEGPRATRWPRCAIAARARRRGRVPDRRRRPAPRVDPVRDPRPRAGRPRRAARARSTPTSVRERCAWADVCVQPSLSEGFCVSVIEAQAMGLPVVCTDADGLPENVAHGVTGFVVPRRDAPALADAAAPTRRPTPGCATGWGAPPATGRRQASTTAPARRLEAIYRGLLELASADVNGVADPAGAGRPAPPAARRAASRRLAQGTSSANCASSCGGRGRRTVQGYVEPSCPPGARCWSSAAATRSSWTSPGQRGGTSRRPSDGVYAGHHPADSASAIAHLEELRERRRGLPRDPRRRRRGGSTTTTELARPPRASATGGWPRRRRRVHRLRCGAGGRCGVRHER